MVPGEKRGSAGPAVSAQRATHQGRGIRGIFPFIPLSVSWVPADFLFNHFVLHHDFFFLILFIYLAALGLSCSMWDLAPWPGIKPGPPALGAQSLSHWTTREVPPSWFLMPILRTWGLAGTPGPELSVSHSPTITSLTSPLTLAPLLHISTCFRNKFKYFLYTHLKCDIHLIVDLMC